MNASIQLANGKFYDFLDPDPSVLDLWVIASALSKIGRFTGHTRFDQPYTVAQHSVLVSYLVPQEHAMMGLMHDAAEALVGDVVSPLKQLLPAYKEIEHKADRAVREAFRLPEVYPSTVKAADLIALATEKRDLMHPTKHNGEWAFLARIKPDPRKIVVWTPAFARRAFMMRFMQLRRVTD